MNLLRQHRHMLGWVATFAALIYVGVAGQSNSDQLRRQAELGAQTHAAVCSLRDDLHLRIKNGEQFLATHPEGLPGIATAQQIRQSIHNERKTISSLSDLEC